MRLLDKLQRETSSGRFIPEIDGLRFVAIALVVLFHLHGFVVTKNPVPYSDSRASYVLLERILENGGHGVELFFVISGFILALPFADYFLNGGRKVRLRQFYIRRVTRLEPPYILAIVGLFCASILIGRYTFEALFPSLLASVVYLHNIVFRTTPLVIVVSWSLEIEIQFYLLAPFIAYVFVIRNPVVRRTLLGALVILFVLLQHFLPLPVLTLYAFAHYFLLGFLLADFYATHTTLRLNKGASILGGAALLGGLLWINTDSVVNEMLFLVLILGFYYLVLNTPFWTRVFSVQPITVMGGMCYSIYLLHYAIISVVGNQTIRMRVTDYYLPNLLLQILLIVPTVLLVSGLYFYLVEKPCMNRHWPKKLYGRLFGSEKEAWSSTRQPEDDSVGEPARWKN